MSRRTATEPPDFMKQVQLLEAHQYGGARKKGREPFVCGECGERQLVITSVTQTDEGRVWAIFLECGNDEHPRVRVIEEHIKEASRK